MSNITVAYDYLMCLIGLPYRWGGDDTVHGFDCSGLAQEFLKATGALPRKAPDMTAQGLCDHFAHHEPEIKFGTLLFFGTPISHVGIALTDKLMVEAGGGNSATKTLEDAARQNAYVRVRPIASRGDLSGTRLPTYGW